MTPEMARERREQMLRDGYCVIPDILSPEFLLELGQESDRLNDTMEHHPDTKYQGTHLGIRYEDNAIMRRLAEWQPAARQALEQMGFGDFKHGGGLIVLTKEPYAPALYWHPDWGQWNNPLSCTPWPQTIFLSYTAILHTRHRLQILIYGYYFNLKKYLGHELALAITVWVWMRRSPLLLLVPK